MKIEAKQKSIPKLRFPEFENSGEWEEKALGEVAEIITGNTPATSDTKNYNGNRLFVSPADISESRYVIKTKTTLSDKGFSQARHIKENSVLFVCIGSTIGKVAQNKYECSTNQQINSLVPHVGYSSDFLYSALEFYAANIANFAGNQAVPIINKSLFLSVLVSFPSLPEQQKIADCLSSLDELIFAVKEKLAALKAYKKGLLQQLFPAEGETVPKIRFAEFRDSGEWVEATLGKCLLKHPEYGIGAAAVPYSTNLPTYLRITDISEDGYFLKSQKVSVEMPVTKENYLDEGDIVFARTGASVGKSYKYRIADGELVFAGFLIRVKPNTNKLNSEFLYQYLSTERYWHWVAFTSTRSGQPGINGNEYASMTLSLPSSINEQQKIAECLSSLDQLIAAQTEQIKTLTQHKKGLLQGLFPSI